MKALKILVPLLAALCIQTQVAYTKKPNVLLIVADDLGYSDAGCYGSEIQTPHLDALAADGLRFTQFYNTARCWSSRSCVLSGYYAQSIRRDKFSGIQFPNDGKLSHGNAGVRPRWAALLPEYLKPQGYRSYMTGKWHIDGRPSDNSFDHDYLDMNNEGYFTQTGASEDGVKLPNIGTDGKFYSTIAIANYAIKHLKDHAENHPGRPFFEYVAFHSPHFPIQALPEDIAIYKDRYQTGWDAMRLERLARMKKMGIVDCELSALDPKTVPRWNLPEAELKKRIGPDEVGYAVPWDSLSEGQKAFQAEKMAVHAAMVHRMDIEIGRILAQLKSMGAYDNTVVMFVSDNGASAEQLIRGLGEDPKAPVGSAYSFLGIGPGWSSFANTPFRLHKSWTHEGGISTPFIVRWPAGIKARGELRTNPGHLIDVVPTVLDISGGQQPATIAGLTVPPLPGRSLVPAFAKDNTVPREFLWWNHENNRAIRMGDWKLTQNGELPWELFDLGKDRSETKDLASQYPDKVKLMEEAWAQHAKEFHALSLQDQPKKGPKKNDGDPKGSAD